MESDIMQINLTELMNVIGENVNAWLPTVTSIISIIVCVVVGMARLKAATKELKNNDTFVELLAELQADRSERKAQSKLLKKYINETRKVMTRNDDTGENRS